MAGYYKNLTIASEEFVFKNLNKSSLRGKVVRNNVININDFDLKINNFFIDVQTSFNFIKYGDLRLDILSAFSFKKDYVKTLPFQKVDILNKEAIEKEIEIYKFGKWFDERLEGVIFLLFNNARPNLNSITDYEIYIEKNLLNIVYLGRKDLGYFLRQNPENLQNIIVNDKRKNNINESHQSAFLPIKLDVLDNNKICKTYKNLDEFKRLFQL